MNLWDSAEKLSLLITAANWGIAATLLIAFVCTVVTIKAGMRRDELIAAESTRLQAALKTNIEALGERVRPRSLNQHWEESIKGRPTGTVELWYNPGDQEAYTLAFTIRHSLLGFGWMASEPIPIPEKRRGDVSRSPNLPTAIKLGTIGVGDTVLRVRKVRPTVTLGEKTAEGALRDGLLFGINGSAGGAVVSDPTLPEGHFVLIVLKK
jgi:hypothetical protein